MGRTHLPKPSGAYGYIYIYIYGTERRRKDLLCIHTPGMSHPTDPVAGWVWVDEQWAFARPPPFPALARRRSRPAGSHLERGRKEKEKIVRSWNQDGRASIQRRGNSGVGCYMS